MPNLPISGLTASASNLSATAVLPVTQTTGVGPVKMTGQQFAGGLLGSTAFNGATVTTSQPLLNLTQTWDAGAVTFTSWRLNVTDTDSNAASLLMDLQVGGATRFNVTKAGGVNIRSVDPTLRLGYLNENQLLIDQGTLVVGSLYRLGFSSSSIGVTAANIDTILTRRAAANLRLGAADAAGSATVTITIATPGVVTWSNHGLSTGTPVIFSTTGALPTGITAGTTYYVIAVDTNTFRIATSLANALAGTAVNTSGSQSGTHTGQRGAIDQALSVQSVVAGTTNFPGADFVITGSQGTGTGAGGSIIFQVAPAGSSGSAQNALATALTIASDRSATFTGALATQNSGSISIQTSGQPTVGLGRNGSVGGLDFFGDNLVTAQANLSASRLILASTVAVAWSSSAVNQPADVLLTRDAANTLALRNGTTAQTFNVYNTFTDASNYERLAVRFASNIARIFTEQAGTGLQRRLEIGTSGAENVYFYTNNTARWFMNFDGHFLAASDNTFDIGASGATRPRNVFVAGYVRTENSFRVEDSAGANGVRFYRGVSANGVLTLYNSAENNFDRLQFGGTSSSFPALKRNSTALETKLADDSAYAPHAMQYLDVTDGITAPASATGRARIYVDTADGDLKVIFADGTVKTIVTDT
jgi:hypothetical protein